MAVAATLAITWITLFATYLLLAQQASPPELVAAAGCASFGTAYTGYVLLFERRWFHFGAVPWLRLAARVGRALFTDTALVGWALIGAVAGRKIAGGPAQQPFDPGPSTSPAAGARRALTILTESVAPNGYVLHVRPPPEGLLLHRLVARPPDPDRQWPG